MKRSFWIAISFLLCSTHLFAAPQYTQWWQAGNRFYQQKQYDSAAFYYEQVAAQKPLDAVIYYNLGNTYYKLNDIGPAVLNYERALHIRPGYKEAEDNLMLTQNRIPNRIQGAENIFFVQWWESMTRATNAGIWATISLLIFISIIGMQLLKRMGRLDFNAMGRTTLILSLICFVTLIIAYFSAANYKSSGAVVMQADSPLLISPQAVKPITLVPEGTTVQIKLEQQGWMEISLPDGRRGWMQSAQLTKI